MLEDNPMLAINVKLWKYFSVIFPGRGNHWRVYAFVLPVCLMNAMQFVYLFRMWGDLTPFILNTFFAAAIFDALLRTCLVIINRDKFEAFILELLSLYKEIEVSVYLFLCVKCFVSGRSFMRKTGYQFKINI